MVDRAVDRGVNLCDPDGFKRLVRKMVAIDPERRATTRELLEDDYLKDIDPHEIPIAPLSAGDE